MFHQSYIQPADIQRVQQALADNQLSSRGIYTQKVEGLIQQSIKTPYVRMTTSCTTALELALRLLDLTADDEVIVPTYSYPSAANAVLMAGAKPVLTTVCKETLSLRLADIMAVRTAKSKAVIAVHYGGVCQDIAAIADYCQREGLVLIEDAAQAYGASYRAKALGSYGLFGCFSFHQTKNITAGEGGAILINSDDKTLQRKCDIMLEKGTDRIAFLNGEQAFYQWQSIGSSYAPSDVLMALLLGQLQRNSQIIDLRMAVIKRYRTALAACLNDDFSYFKGFLEANSRENGHLFYLNFKSPVKAQHFYEYMRTRQIDVRRHFLPLHVSPMGKRYIAPQPTFSFEDNLFDTLIRLPLYAPMPKEQVDSVIDSLYHYFGVNP